MKLIIKIDDEMYQNVLNDIYCGTLYKELKNGIPIPDNATNGDVIKAMFPNGTTAKFATFMRFIDGEHYFNCSEEWWREPYQKGGK